MASILIELSTQSLLAFIEGRQKYKFCLHVDMSKCIVTPAQHLWSFFKRLCNCEGTNHWLDERMLWYKQRRQQNVTYLQLIMMQNPNQDTKNKANERLTLQITLIKILKWKGR